MFCATHGICIDVSFYYIKSHHHIHLKVVEVVMSIYGNMNNKVNSYLLNSYYFYLQFL